jgi:hypothetical protein
LSDSPYSGAKDSDYVKVEFWITREQKEVLDFWYDYLSKSLDGRCMSKSEIVRRALQEYFEKISDELPQDLVLAVRLNKVEKLRRTLRRIEQFAKLADEDESIKKEFLDWYENDAKKLLEQLKRERKERGKEKTR